MALVPTWVFVAYAADVLSFHREVFNGSKDSGDSALGWIADDLPRFLAGRRAVGVSLSFDDSMLAAAVTEVAQAESRGLLQPHEGMAGSDLDDVDVVQSLLTRVEAQWDGLRQRRVQ
jgi:hypothetical protein